MMKRIIVAALCLLLLLEIPVLFAYAHDDRKEHYEELEAVLFDNRRYSSTSLSESQKRNIQILEYATTVCIDQTGQTADQGLLDDLNRWGVRDIPESVSEINPGLGEKSIPKGYHRMYTHRGWDYVYADDRAHWSVRKNILVSASHKVFGDSFTNKNQCDSFAAVLYYVHILGDYIEDVSDGDFRKFNGSTNGLKIRFALANPGASNPDIFYELEHHLQILFSNQISSRKYMALISDIEDLAAEARSIVSQQGEINSYERLMEIKPKVLELMDILTGENDHFNYIHELLNNEAFFNKVF